MGLRRGFYLWNVVVVAGIEAGFVLTVGFGSLARQAFVVTAEHNQEALARPI